MRLGDRMVRANRCELGVGLLLFTVIPRPAPAQQARLDIPRLAELVKPATVVIQTRDERQRPLGYGSGFFTARDQVITNRHVIDGGAGATVHTEDGRTYPVTAVLAVGDGVDLARLEVGVPAAASPTTLPLAARSPAVGEPVVAVGNPADQLWSVTEGIVSAFRERPEFGPVVQISAAVWHGSSGGPVVNAAGEVIGVVVGSTPDQPPGINFAVRVEEVHRLTPAFRLTLSEWNRRRSAEVLVHAEALYREISWEYVLDEPISSHVNERMLDMTARCHEAIPYLQATGRWWLIARCAMFQRRYAEAIPYLRRELIEAHGEYAGTTEATRDSVHRGSKGLMELLADVRAGRTSFYALAFDRLIARYHLAWVLYYLGRSHLAVERNAEAPEIFERALEYTKGEGGLFDQLLPIPPLSNSDPRSRIYAGLAIAHLRLGRVAEAAEVTRECRRLMANTTEEVGRCDPGTFW